MGSTSSSRRRSSCRTSTTSPAMNEVYARHVGDRPPARSTVEVSTLPSGALVEIEAVALPLTVTIGRARGASVADYVHSLGLDAYVVGGAVRDELLGLPSRSSTSSSRGRPRRAARRARAARPRRGPDRRRPARRRPPPPRDREARALQPAGIEFAPPRVERSTGPGRHDFEIVADASISLEEDMARRDFTVNAIARRLETGELLDPLGGRGRSRAPHPAHDEPDELPGRPAADRARPPLRLAARLRPRRGHAARRCANGRRSSATSRASGSAAGSRATGWASSRSSCSARDAGEGAPARARHRRARPPPARVRAGDRLRPGEPPPPPAARRAPLRGRPGRRRRGRAAPVRLAALFHDLGKPESAWRGRTGGSTSTRRRARKPRTTRRSARSSRGAAPRLRYPTRCAAVVRIVREHMFELPRRTRAVRARRFLARHGEDARARPARHKDADLAGKRGRARGASSRLERSSASARLVERGARRSRTGSPTSPSTAPT